MIQHQRHAILDESLMPPAIGRREPRLTQHRRSIGLLVDGTVFPMVLKNLSCRGASGVVEEPISCLGRVTLLFEGGRRVGGQIRWSRGNEIGIELAGQLPLAVLVGSSSGHAARERRIAVRRPATIVVHGQERAATIRNISSGGMLIETVLGLVPGQSIEVWCGKAFRLVGQVRWAARGRGGLQFPAPIDLDAFDEATS